MSILDRLRKRNEDQKEAQEKMSKASDTASKKTEKTPAKKDSKKSKKSETVSAKAGSHISGVLVRPVITEKATLTGTYIFEVTQSANKSEVKKAVQRAYGVTPKNVRIMNVSGKRVRWGRVEGTRKNWKKAVVRLKDGDSINVYEGI